jgi:acyl-CoA thioesterase-1
VVALGASQTAGKGVDPDEAYPAQLEAMLRARGKDVRVINAGINGDTTGGMLARLDADVPNGTRVVILQPGTNDKIAGERNHNAETITARLRARGIAVILIEHTGRTVPSTMRQADGQHLTEAGYRLLASSLLPRVLAALGR